MTYSLLVKHEPVPQPRQRYRVVRAAKGAFAQNYTPARHPVNDYKFALRIAWRAAHGDTMLEGALSLTVCFVLKRARSRRRGGIWHAHRPDVDNLLKSVMDALNSVAWRDDGQIARLRADKRYAAEGEAPRVAVLVEPMVESDGV